MSNFSRLLNASAGTTFWTLHVRANLIFLSFNVSLSFRAQSAKNTCLRFAIFNFSEKLQNIFEIGLKNIKCTYKIVLREKISRKKKFAGTFLFFTVLIYPLSKFGGNRTNSLWVLAFYGVRFKWKKLIGENSAKCVNQTGNFDVRPKLKTAISLPILNLFQWFLFYIRDIIWIITLTEKSKFEENCPSEGIL